MRKDTIDIYICCTFQAVKWLNDLFNVLLRNHMEVGCNVKEIQSQKEEHQSFQETAKVKHKLQIGILL